MATPKGPEDILLEYLRQFGSETDTETVAGSLRAHLSKIFKHEFYVGRGENNLIVFYVGGPSFEDVRNQIPGKFGSVPVIRVDEVTSKQESQPAKGDAPREEERACGP